MRELIAVSLLLLAALTVAACGGDEDAGTSGDPADLQGKTFVAVTLEQDGSRLPIEGPVGVSFEKRYIDLSTDCNGAGGRVEISENTLEVTNLANTLMGCSDELLAQDDLLYELLNSGPTWTLTGGELELTSNGTVLTLQEEPSSQPDAPRG